jgi:hypothetical protein
MTIGLWVAIVTLLLALASESIVFWRRRTLLRTKEQRFRFHDLRDRLQLLVIEHKLEPGTRLHHFLLATINLAIRNAGVLKLREIIALSRSVKKEARGENTFVTLQAEIVRQPKEVQALSAEVFNSLAAMLIVNDSLTSLLFQGLGFLTKIANDLAQVSRRLC